MKVRNWSFDRKFFITFVAACATVIPSTVYATNVRDEEPPAERVVEGIYVPLKDW